MTSPTRDDAASAPQAPRPRVDALDGVAWMVIGTVIAVLSLRMERAEHLGATAITAPGLVPAGLGFSLVLLGLLLALRRAPAGPSERSDTLPDVPGGAWRVLTALALILLYALVMVGSLPFAVATGLFVAAFILIFELMKGVRGPAALRSAVMAIVIGAGTGGIITYVFQNLFLVRLP